MWWWAALLQGSLRADGSNVSHLLLSAASPDLFCHMSGDGGPGKNAEAGSNHSSPVISAFRGNCITCIPTPYFSHMDFAHYVIIIIMLYTQITCFFSPISLKCSSRSLIPNTTNTSALWKSVETSPSRAKGPFFSCTEWPGIFNCVGRHNNCFGSGRIVGFFTVYAVFFGWWPCCYSGFCFKYSLLIIFRYCL